ncbi:hypothetical protein GCM10022196_17140 [Aeromicrobium flavum]
MMVTDHRHPISTFSAEPAGRLLSMAVGEMTNMKELLAAAAGTFVVAAGVTTLAGSAWGDE